MGRPVGSIGGLIAAAIGLLALQCGGSGGATVAQTGHDAGPAPVEAGDARRASRDAGDAGAPVSKEAEASPPDATDMLPKGLGWHILPGTALLSSSACAPDVGQEATEGCAAAINDWNGGVYVPSHRWLVFGMGGHDGYFGNELYALELAASGGGTGGTIVRLYDPTPHPTTSPGWNSGGSCNPPMLYDGRPDSNHTYGGFGYSPSRDTLIMAQGSGSPCGYGMYESWSLDMSTLPSSGYPGSVSWKQVAKTGLVPGREFGGNGDGLGDVGVYDPHTDKFYLHTQYELASYDFATDTYARLSDFNSDSHAYISDHASATLDTKRHLFIVVGGGYVRVVDISSGGAGAMHQGWDLGSACSALVGSGSPGLAYDPVADKVLGIVGNSNTIYLIDTAAKTCTSEVAGGDTVLAPKAANGVFGRFAYSDFCDCFAYVADPGQNAYALRTR